MAKEPFPRVSQAQVEIWLDDPVTKAYLTAIAEKDRVTGLTISEGTFRDLSNNDLTMNMESELHGRRFAYNEMLDAEKMLHWMGLVKVEEQEVANG